MVECPYLQNCPFFNRLQLSATAEMLKERYCKGNFENCARYKLRKDGKPVPDNLWPNGKML
ncbi:hypothetical protein [Archaeoglobus profundus]|uniref:Uracil-DNA glycosylase n=1 Tax=Archaeoglobus profundus (strain DSM 5631 / JCM 9629 / NBRC 100127 / Av18) TaxID=572546 RepID=D2RDC7_ARCPA|nr:hypothetical protein [Archaeoglobus profundus]ADB58121.1 conserved hypothetical protein [Archaeoglobus profundus DSM 5631]